MNIIKFKDMIMPGNSYQATLYNEHLKGKYAYWIRMRYVVSFDHMDNQAYIACEEDIDKLLPCCGKLPVYGAPYFDTYCNTELYPYIDEKTTEMINDNLKFKIENEYSTDIDLTIEDLRYFRTWLAKTMLDFDMGASGNYMNKYFTHHDILVLEYYSKNMTDDVLNVLDDPVFSILDKDPHPVNCGCGCGCSPCKCNEEIFVSDSPVNCDPAAIYRHRMYLYMINLFSNIDFWNKFPKPFLVLVKKYIDNIIKLNLPLGKELKQDFQFNDCTDINATAQELSINILKKFSNSLGYIQNDQISGRKNYISSSLNEWASKLYEYMVWPTEKL